MATPLTLDEKSAFLKTIPLFSGLSPEILQTIAGRARERAYPAQTLVFHEGDPGDTMYLILSGIVALVKDGVVLGTRRRAGDTVGELALLDEQPRSASLMAVADLRALEVPRSDLETLLRETPFAARDLLKTLSTRLRESLDVQLEAVRQEAARTQELKLAAEIQRSLFPQMELSNPQIHTAGSCNPAHTIGGDYYDYFTLPHHHIGILIADVVGHGFHSALLVAMVKSCAQLVSGQTRSVSRLIHAVSTTIEQAPDNFFMTLCYLVLNTETRLFSYANAGHPFPLFYRRLRNRLETLNATFLPLGLMPDIPFPRNGIRQRTWDPGDVLLLYSDGVTEAMDSDENLYGEDRLRQSFLSCVDESPEEIRRVILRDLESFSPLDGSLDDVTVVVIRLD